MILFARIAILDPEPLIIFSKKLHLDCVSNMFDNVPFEKQCNQNEVLLHLGRFRMDSEVLRRLLVEPYHSLFLLELFHSEMN